MTQPIGNQQKNLSTVGKFGSKMRDAARPETAGDWYAEGVKEHIEFQEAFARAKGHALNAGYFFSRAREAIQHGDFLLFCDSQESGVSRRMVYRYMHLYEAVRAWALEQQPTLKGEEKILQAGLEMEMQSPREFVEVCRQVGLMRKFGEYDAVKHAAEKRRKGLGEPRQMEFRWSLEMAEMGLRCFRGLDQVEEDKRPNAEQIAALLAELDAARERLLEMQRTVTLVVVNGTEGTEGKG